MIERMMIVHWTMRQWSFPSEDATSGEEPRSERDSAVPAEEYSNIDEETMAAVDDRWKDDGNDEADLLIPILFYYDSQNTIDQEIYRRSMLQFAGVSHALYHLPQTILPLLNPSLDSEGDNDDAENLIQGCAADRTKVVHFDAATAWVFVPLGSPPNPSEQPESRTVDIVAIVQIKTSEIRPHGTAATPTAVMHSLRRAYALFSLLRHGSIHERLLNPPPGKTVLQQNHADPEYYPGIDEVYQWHRRNHRRHPFLAYPSLLPTLPYIALRRDLEFHFNDWIMNCNHCRNIIECIPPPISNVCESASWTSNKFAFPAEINPNIAQALESAMNELFQMNDEPLSQLIGMSFFVQNQIVAIGSSFSPARSCHVINTSKGIALPNETAILLHQYMEQIQYQMAKPLSDSVRPPEKKKGISLRLPSFARSFLKDDTMPLPPNRTQLPAFLPPPPLSILNVVEDTESSAFLYQNQTVWAPPVALKVADDSIIAARVCLFSHDKVHALIYLARATEGEPKHVYGALLTVIASAFFRVVGTLLAVDGHVPREKDKIDDPNSELSVPQRSWDTMDGFDLIAVDRSLNISKIYVDEVDPTVISAVPHSSHPLDDRYVLLYHLSMDTLLAFEDAIDEVQRYQKNNRANQDPSKRLPCFERCTLLRNHWVYCHAYQEKELYLLFHTSRFVTMADVQRVALRLRNEFWNDLE
jgi:hypothetical protein